MKNKFRGTRPCFTGILVMALLTTLAGNALAVSDSATCNQAVQSELAGEPTQDPLIQQLGHLPVDGDYPKNSKGETYGPYILSEVTGHAPDLLLALGTNGETGYIRESDDPTYKCRTMTLEEIAAYQKALPSTCLIPLYDAEGTVIGSFRLSGFSPTVTGKVISAVKEEIGTTL